MIFDFSGESRESGGLIGRRLRQGACRSPELDRACFVCTLGQVSGPVQSAEGFHLVLVEERLGLPMHDSGMTRVVAEPSEDGAVRSVLKPADPSDDGNELLAPENVVMLVASTAMVAVLGDAIATVASGF